MKVTVLYGHPTDTEEFDKYYKETHSNFQEDEKKIRIEITKFLAGPDGAALSFYQMAELYFASPENMQETFASPEGQATSSELANFATGGVTMLIGMVTN